MMKSIENIATIISIFGSLSGVFALILAIIAYRKAIQKFNINNIILEKQTIKVVEIIDFLRKTKVSFCFKNEQINESVSLYDFSKDFLETKEFKKNSKCEIHSEYQSLDSFLINLSDLVRNSWVPKEIIERSSFTSKYYIHYEKPHESINSDNCYVLFNKLNFKSKKKYNVIIDQNNSNRKISTDVFLKDLIEFIDEIKLWLRKNSDYPIDLAVDLNIPSRA